MKNVSISTDAIGLRFHFNRGVVGLVLIWAAVFIYAAANSVVTLLVNIGEANPVDGRNAITFCNLFVLGSAVSLIPMVAIYFRDWNMYNLRNLKPGHWILLLLSTVLSSVVTPGLFFFALSETTVTNIAIIGRIDPPVFLFAAALFLGERVDPWALAGGLVALVGAVAILVLKDAAVAAEFGLGELAAFVATLSFTASTIVTRAGLRHVPMGIFAIFRTAVGTVIYVALTFAMFGHHHFDDLFQPVLLKWIWVYAFLVILLGQFAWNYGLKWAKARDVALATSFSPLAAIAIAMFLLGENPGAGLVPGATIIFAGILIAEYGRRRGMKTQKISTGNAVEFEGRCNFKGV